MGETSLEAQQNISMQKANPKDIKHSTNNKRSKIGKICDNAWAIAFAKCQFGSKIKIFKNMRKTSP